MESAKDGLIYREGAIVCRLRAASRPLTRPFGAQLLSVRLRDARRCATKSDTETQTTPKGGVASAPNNPWGPRLVAKLQPQAVHILGACQ